MYLIVGLGNPSPKYDHTRHNAGREAVAEWLKQQITTVISVPGSDGETYRLVRQEDRSQKLEAIITPDLGTFMNESGPAVQKALSFLKISIENLIVVHDELALPLGTFRLAKNISAAGHNGVQSVIEALGTQAFMRMRLGVESRPDHQLPSEDFVLQKMNDEDYNVAKAMYQRAGLALTSILQNGFERTMNEYNRS